MLSSFRQGRDGVIAWVLGNNLQTGIPQLKVQEIQRRRQDSHREIKTSRDKRKEISGRFRSLRHVEQVGLRAPPGDQEEVCQKAPGKEAGEGSSV